MKAHELEKLVGEQEGKELMGAISINKQSLGPDLFRSLIPIYESAAEELYLSAHDVQGRDCTFIRLWTELPEIENGSGHPDYTLNRDILLLDMKVRSREDQLTERYHLGIQGQPEVVTGGSHAKETRIYKLK